MSIGSFLGGVVVLGVVGGSLWFAAHRLRRRLVPEWSGAIALLAESVLFLALLLTGAQLLGAVGLFGRWSLVVASAVTAAVIRVLVEPVRNEVSVGVRTAPPVDATGRGRTRPVGGPVMAIALVVMAVLPWLDRSIGGLRSGVLGYDSVNYHMPFAARFFQSGSFQEPHFTFPGLETAFHPQSAEVLHGVGMLALRTDVLSPVLNLGWLGLVLLAGWCAGRSRRLELGTLAVTVVFVTCPLIVSMNAGRANNDLAGVALFLAAVALLLNAEGRSSALGLAGASAGMALGMKLTLVAPVALLTVGVVVFAQRGRRAATARTWLLWLFVTGGFWYARNLLLVGNPVPALDLHIGSLALPTSRASGTSTDFTVAHYLTDWSVWRAWFIPGLRDSYGLLWAVIIGLAALGCIGALLRGDRLVRMLGAVATASLVAYVVTPASALGQEGRPTLFANNLRFALPGLVVGGVLFVLVGSSASRGRRWPAILCGAIAFVNATIYSVRGRADLRLAVALAVTLGALALVGLVMLVRTKRLGLRLGSAVFALLLAIGIVLGWRVEREYLQRRYHDAVHSLPNASVPREEVAALYVWIGSVSDARIAVVGFGWQYPLFGADLSNHVQYVGHETSDGAFESVESCREWRSMLNAGRYDFVVTSANDSTMRRGPREAAWTDTDSAVTPIVEVETLTVFQVDGPLHPSTCG